MNGLKLMALRELDKVAINHGEMAFDAVYGFLQNPTLAVPFLRYLNYP